MNALTAAQQYLAKGYSPIPIPCGSKAPTMPKWQELRFCQADLHTHFGDATNIGLLLGRPSGNLVDVDIDAPEALTLADAFLPTTGMIHGRPGNPRSHLWYRPSEAIPPKKFSAPDGSCLIEIRSTGQQTVVPPSVHPSGEVVAWASDGIPAAISAEILQAATAETAAAALLVREYPNSGSRQDFWLAFCGAALRNGRDIDWLTQFIHTVTAAVGDEECGKRVGVARRTMETLQAGRPVTGYRRLVELVGEGVARKLAEWLGFGRPPTNRKAGAQNPASSDLNRVEELIDVAGQGSLFHSEENEAFIALPGKQRQEVLPVKSPAFKGWLTRAARERLGHIPRDVALREAIDLLSIEGQYYRPRRDVFLRVANIGTTLYVDLANEARQIVEVTAEGWRLADACPAAFHRPPSMRALPVPMPLNDLTYFDELFNFGSADDRRLVIAWLAYCLRSSGPYPVLVLQGEAGSAKSTMARMLRTLIDPVGMPLRWFSRDERDLAIAARSNHILCFDNLSGLSDRDSDMLCRVATGAGVGTRQLYSDNAEVTLLVQRPVMLNGIDDLATRQDLIDRAIVLDLPAIAPQQRRDEATLSNNFNACHPHMLGALLTLAATGLRKVNLEPLQNPPRMADFGRFAAAIEEDLGWPAGGFMTAYRYNQANALESSLESSPVAAAVQDLLTREPRWQGTAMSLLMELTGAGREILVRSHAWPRSPAKLSNQLRRVVSALRMHGVEVSFDRSSTRERSRTIILRRIGSTDD